MDYVNFASARQPYDPYTIGVSQSHGTCQVRRFIASVNAAKSDNNRLKLFHLLTCLQQRANLGQDLRILEM